MRGVTNGAAPPWMRRKLTAIGQKPISALVDITNFVMIDLGRPLHVYDQAKLQGGLVARKAKAGEQVLALNGKTYTLDETMTVIADDAHVHDIGGIMGGEDSGVSDATTDVVIECAYFDPEAIARTGQKLGADQRCAPAVRARGRSGVPGRGPGDRDVAGGWSIAAATASGVTRSGEPPLGTRAIAYDTALAANLGGLDVAADRQKAILEGLGFAVAKDWQVTVAELAPRYRRAGRSGRGGHPHRRHRQGAVGAAAARRGRRRADRDPGAEAANARCAARRPRAG